MYAVEQALLVLALVGVCGLAYRLMRGGSGGSSCDAGGDCGCSSRPADLTQIGRKKKV